ncbi:uncharacterized protein EV422DRAFT_175377 [Fimicolochytrium jonesii]|uniref:uncharacterized protein n=1 Tax=Fimicolochytrium jonesii TaxID=1396493 RepID=UPI0022FE31FA|nr:uncharacterized protein EV422DRAFT_175377 [Fimicolochytrium jonesii]KAI8818621.1 hypothetical protein EV422DRAFT_175377 [Fimicolochytrium jonesii]
MNAFRKLLKISGLAPLDSDDEEDQKTEAVENLVGWKPDHDDLADYQSDSEREGEGKRRLRGKEASFGVPYVAHEVEQPEVIRRDYLEESKSTQMTVTSAARTPSVLGVRTATGTPSVLGIEDRIELHRAATVQRHQEPQIAKPVWLAPYASSPPRAVHDPFGREFNVSVSQIPSDHAVASHSPPTPVARSKPYVSPSHPTTGYAHRRSSPSPSPDSASDSFMARPRDVRAVLQRPQPEPILVEDFEDDRVKSGARILPTSYEPAHDRQKVSASARGAPTTVSPRRTHGNERYARPSTPLYPAKEEPASPTAQARLSRYLQDKEMESQISQATARSYRQDELDSLINQASPPRYQQEEPRRRDSLAMSSSYRQDESRRRESDAMSSSYRQHEVREYAPRVQRNDEYDATNSRAPIPRYDLTEERSSPNSRAPAPRSQLDEHEPLPGDKVPVSRLRQNEERSSRNSNVGPRPRHGEAGPYRRSDGRKTPGSKVSPRRQPGKQERSQWNGGRSTPNRKGPAPRPRPDEQDRSPRTEGRGTPNSKAQNPRPQRVEQERLPERKASTPRSHRDDDLHFSEPATPRFDADEEVRSSNSKPLTPSSREELRSTPVFVKGYGSSNSRPPTPSSRQDLPPTAVFHREHASSNNRPPTASLQRNEEVRTSNSKPPTPVFDRDAEFRSPNSRPPSPAFQRNEELRLATNTKPTTPNYRKDDQLRANSDLATPNTPRNEHPGSRANKVAPRFQELDEKMRSLSDIEAAPSYRRNEDLHPPANSRSSTVNLQNDVESGPNSKLSTPSLPRNEDLRSQAIELAPSFQEDEELRLSHGIEAAPSFQGNADLDPPPVDLPVRYLKDNELPSSAREPSTPRFQENKYPRPPPPPPPGPPPPLSLEQAARSMRNRFVRNEEQRSPSSKISTPSIQRNEDLRSSASKPSTPLLQGNKNSRPLPPPPPSPPPPHVARAMGNEFVRNEEHRSPNSKISTPSIQRNEDVTSSASKLVARLSKVPTPSPQSDHEPRPSKSKTSTGSQRHEEQHSLNRRPEAMSYRINHVALSSPSLKAPAPRSQRNEDQPSSTSETPVFLSKEAVPFWTNRQGNGHHNVRQEVRSPTKPYDEPSRSKGKGKAPAYLLDEESPSGSRSSSRGAQSRFRAEVGSSRPPSPGLEPNLQRTARKPAAFVDNQSQGYNRAGSINGPASNRQPRLDQEEAFARTQTEKSLYSQVVNRPYPNWKHPAALPNKRTRSGDDYQHGGNRRVRLNFDGREVVTLEDLVASAAESDRIPSTIEDFAIDGKRYQVLDNPLWHQRSRNERNERGASRRNR